MKGIFYSVMIALILIPILSLVIFHSQIKTENVDISIRANNPLMPLLMPPPRSIARLLPRPALIWLPFYRFCSSAVWSACYSVN